LQISALKNLRVLQIFLATQEEKKKKDGSNACNKKCQAAWNERDKAKLSKNKLSKCQCCYPLTREESLSARAAALVWLHPKSVSGVSAERRSVTGRQTKGHPSFPKHRLPPS